MKTRQPLLRFIIGSLVLLVLLFLAANALGHHSPTVDLLGSYFPAWMVCIVSGLTLTIIAHWIVQLNNLKPYLGPGPLIYPCLMIIFTFGTWILFYQN